MAEVSASAGVRLGPARAGWWRPWEPAVAATVAATMATIAILAGWRGVDLAAHISDVAQFQRDGLTLWDSQLFGGRWLLGYSVIYSPVASTLGLPVTAVLSAAAAAWAFDRLVRPHFGAAARWGSLAFALGTVAQVAIGQLPFLLGEALALLALAAAAGRRWLVAIGLAVATTLASPLAGVFLALAAAAWMVSTWPRGRAGLAAVIVAALGPAMVSQALFPQGAMPFSRADFVLTAGVFGILAWLVPRHERALRTGAVLYLLAILGSFVLPTAMGANIIRLGGCVALPLVICAFGVVPRGRLALLVLSPIVVLTWAPVWASATTGREADSTSPSYYAPLTHYLQAHAAPAGRVEVVPTALHWEAVYVAPHIPLARGWVRQLDVTDNPLFYRSSPLDAAAYRSWLMANGVRFVALPDARLDDAGGAEAHLLSRPPPGLHLVWHDAHWKVFALAGSTGIVSGPAQIVHLGAQDLVIRAVRPGPILIRLRPADRWSLVSGPACLDPSTRTGTVVTASRPGTVVLRLDILAPTSHAC